jgi:cytosine/adenosine deaminase-related metal-dependent hydrolase
VAVWAKSSWTLVSMLKIPSGQCILVWSRTESSHFLELSRCTRNGTVPRMIEFVFGSELERLAGKSQRSLPSCYRLILRSRVSDELYREMTTISKTRNIPITMHCAEVKADREFFESRGHTPMSYCDSVGLLGPQTVLVHMVHLDDSDIQTLAETQTNVAHCPTSNAKLASGLCRVPDLQKAGVNIGLGTDGAPCNNTCDLMQEMKLAAIIHKPASYDPTAVPAEDVLEMATINGAKALGLADQIGSLEIGKKADFVAIDMRKIHLQPWFSPVSAVVYSATGRDVEMVVVDGKVVVENGKLTTLNEQEVMLEAMKRSKEVVKRAGLTQTISSRWPVL